MLAVAAIFCCVTSMRTPADAQFAETVYHVWKTYTNARFQYAICYPVDLLTPEKAAPNSDGQRFLGTDGTRLIVYGQHIPLDLTLPQIFAETASQAEGLDGHVSYKVLKPGWFVVSGNIGPTTFYAKTMYRNQVFKAFEITYRRSMAAIYDPVVGHLASCFTDLAR